MAKLKTYFFGTPDISVPSLEALTQNPQIELLGVISQPDRPAGRGQELKSPEVIQYCKSKKIPYFQTENINKDESLLEKIEKSSPDIFIVFAFAQFLGSRVLTMPKFGCFNIHTSLLPKYRGAAPIQYALLNGDTSTGVSIQKMVKKMDAGDIVHSYPVIIDPEETASMLYHKLKDAAVISLNQFIENLFHGNLKPQAQDESKVTFAPTIDKEEGLIKFNLQTFSEIKNRFRAFDPWPGIYCFLGSKRMKILEIIPSNQKLSPGVGKAINQELHVGCKEGSLRIKTLQLEGKSKTTDSDFLKGFRDEIRINP